MLRAQIVKVVHKSGISQGAENSSNITSKAHINTPFITNPNNPKVIILNGKVITSKIGFIKKFKSPSIIPKTRKICQVSVMFIPKKLELGSTATLTFGTKYDANQSPAVAAII